MYITTYALLTKCEVKMTGYWPSIFLPRQGALECKKRMRPISNHLDQTSLVNKGFIIMAKQLHQSISLCKNKAGNPERARWAYLSNQNTGFASIMHLACSWSLQPYNERQYCLLVFVSTGFFQSLAR